MKLHIVEETEGQPIDIGALLRAERDDPERWRRVHVESYRRKPLFVPDAPKRLWLK